MLPQPRKIGGLEKLSQNLSWLSTELVNFRGLAGVILRIQMLALLELISWAFSAYDWA